VIVALLVITSLLGIAFATVVYRADPHRWDNQVFAAIGLADAVLAGMRAVAVLQGASLGDYAVNRGCVLPSVLLAYLSFEFAWSFPESKPAPRWARVAVGIISAAMVALIFTPVWKLLLRFITLIYFLPMFGLMFGLLVRTARRLEGRAALPVKLVMIALGSRWVAAMISYLIARNISAGAFETALTVEATASVLVAFVLVGYAVLSGNLFRVRGLAAEVLVYTAFALAVATATVVAIEAVLAWAPGPTPLRFGLVAAALVPLVLVAVGRRFVARLEAAVLEPLDPRRALRASVVERVLQTTGGQVDAQTLLGEACTALREITGGAEIRLLRAPGRKLPGNVGELAAADAERLAGEPFRAGAGELLVAVRAGGTLYGALALTGGQLDRDTLLAAQTLAGHFAVRIENQALFAELEESRRLATLGAFAAAIAHDIRTPLASVQMNVQILRGKVELPPGDMEHFDIALDELRRLNQNIQELLDYAKPVRLAPAPIELRDVADDAARGIASVLAERGVTLEVELPEGLPPVRADAQRLRQVLLNLLDNAAKASSRGAAVTLRGSAAEGGRVTVEVADQGRGIEAGDLPKIFEPFFTTRADGTGLGLAIVQKLVRAHAGEVVVRSSPGKGSTFTVVLPAAG
jgi:signal transduction histidine kinase